MYFISIGRAYLIQPLHILTLEGAAGNRLRINGRKQARQKIIDCFQTPAGGGITKQKQLPGMFEIAFLQIRQPPRIQKRSERNGNAGSRKESISKSAERVKFTHGQ